LAGLEEVVSLLLLMSGVLSWYYEKRCFCINVVGFGDLSLYGSLRHVVLNDVFQSLACLCFLSLHFLQCLFNVSVAFSTRSRNLRGRMFYTDISILP
jgi:hypothetical protein